jgi:hypothetical protein
LDQEFPKNIKYCFSQNALKNSENIIPIPIGLRNSFPHYIQNQSPILSGAPYEDGEYSSKKLTEIYLNDNTSPTKFLYSNFLVSSNLGYRSFIRDLCINTSHINYEEPDGKFISDDTNQYDNYLNQILDHQSTFCPAGNGIDTHRIWEVLYCKRIPITINANSFKTIKINSGCDGESFQIPPQETEYAIYNKLYPSLPIVILENYEQLLDENYLRSQIEYQKNKKHNMEVIDFNYWKSKILKLEKTLK